MIKNLTRSTQLRAGESFCRYTTDFKFDSSNYIGGSTFPIASNVSITWTDINSLRRQIWDIVESHLQREVLPSNVQIDPTVEMDSSSDSTVSMNIEPIETIPLPEWRFTNRHVPIIDDLDRFILIKEKVSKKKFLKLNEISINLMKTMHRRVGMKRGVIVRVVKRGLYLTTKTQYTIMKSLLLSFPAPSINRPDNIFTNRFCTFDWTNYEKKRELILDRLTNRLKEVHSDRYLGTDCSWRTWACHIMNNIGIDHHENEIINGQPPNYLITNRQFTVIKPIHINQQKIQTKFLNQSIITNELEQNDNMLKLLDEQMIQLDSYYNITKMNIEKIRTTLINRSNCLCEQQDMPVQFLNNDITSNDPSNDYVP
ncbi:hypothetical protein BC833DRAFT_567604 [Globomyces pollinis-pini]|nr:hypothetical protein BC833DRAFT_567604 [Globomyces pollinis-pini]